MGGTTLLAIRLRFGIPDLTQIPPRGVPRTGIGLVDGELGGGADAGAETRRAEALMAYDEQIVGVGAYLEQLAGAVEEGQVDRHSRHRVVRKLRGTSPYPLT
jgi:hypothetical protein